MENNIADAKNFGFIARMNQAIRVPAHDAKFLKAFWGGLNSKVLGAWLQGWDEANLEYANYNYKNKSNEQ
jgi:hypothetical protein